MRGRAGPSPDASPIAVVRQNPSGALCRASRKRHDVEKCDCERRYDCRPPHVTLSVGWNAPHSPFSRKSRRFPPRTKRQSRRALATPLARLFPEDACSRRRGPCINEDLVTITFLAWREGVRGVRAELAIIG